MKMARLAGIALLMATAVISGCATMDDEDEGGFLLMIQNRTDELLQDVIVINAYGKRKHFGYVGRSSDKAPIIDPCAIAFIKDFPIQWYGDGRLYGRMLDLSKYESSREKIASLTFIYLGHYEWSVVVKDAQGRAIVPGKKTPRRAS